MEAGPIRHEPAALGSLRKRLREVLGSPYYGSAIDGSPELLWGP